MKRKDSEHEFEYLGNSISENGLLILWTALITFAVLGFLIATFVL